MSIRFQKEEMVQALVEYAKSKGWRLDAGNVWELLELSECCEPRKQTEE